MVINFFLLSLIFSVSLASRVIPNDLKLQRLFQYIRRKVFNLLVVTDRYQFYLVLNQKFLECIAYNHTYDFCSKMTYSIKSSMDKPTTTHGCVRFYK